MAQKPNTLKIKPVLEPLVEHQEKPFSANLRQAMLDLNVNNAWLARALWGTRTDSRGYEVPRNRDRIGQYLKGTSLPNDANMRRMAEILKCDYEWLAPPERRKAESGEQFSFICTDEDYVRVKINMQMDSATASEINLIVLTYIKRRREDQLERTGNRHGKSGADASNRAASG